MRLIDADELKLKIVEEGQQSKRYKVGDFWELNRNEIWGVIDGLPTIEERKTGKWITMSDADGIYWTCSECGEDIPRIAHFNPEFDLFPRLESIDKTDYCPMCGAQMRETP